MGSDIKSTARHVFGALCEYANCDRAMWPSWVQSDFVGFAAWPSIGKIAEVTGLGERTIQEALHLLENAGAIACLYRSKGGAPTRSQHEPGKSSCYGLTPHLVHRYKENESEKPLITPQVMRGSSDSNAEKVGATPQVAHRSQPEPRTSCTVTTQEPRSTCTPNPAAGAPYVFIEKTAAAAAVGPTQIRAPDRQLGELTADELAEIKRIEAKTGVRIDGMDALRLKAGVEQADLTLAHLRWFLRDERFVGARSPTAVLLTIAREFRERSRGMEWPDRLDDAESFAERPGFRGKEILQR